ncbi:MAG TPA: hypothetical protein VHT34_05855 [Clostridia bacterium]|nr:hypothetical protein [Clostridia bacterium]
MLKSKLEIFVTKRVLIFFIILSIFDIVLLDKRWLVLLGLFPGSLLCILRFSSNALLLKEILSSAADYGESRHAGFKSVLFFIINQIILVFMLFVFYKISPWAFAGFTAGLVLVPFVLMLNGITEALRITHNNFE